MNQEIKAEWLKRLRSGEYEQTTGHLHDEGGYCCLGVLAEYAAEQGVCEVTKFENISSYDGSMALLPHSVVEWAELDDEFGGNQHELTDKNDLGTHATLDDGTDEYQSWDFNRIADYIEANL